MIVVRALLTLLIAAGAAFAVKTLAVDPLRCNQLERAVIADTEVVFVHPESIESWRVPVLARQSVVRINDCLGPCTVNPNLLMLYAANLRVLGQHESAIEAYQRALKLDRRPEIYFNLGMTELALGRQEAAIRDFVKAGRSGYLFNDIEIDLVREEVERRLRETSSENDGW